MSRRISPQIARRIIDGFRLLFLLTWLVIAGIWLVYLLDAPFHEDEAIYAAWGLRILRGDFWLWETPVDKPPLTFYPMALTVALFGRHEWAARLPNLFWMLLLLASLWRIARRRGACGWFVVGLSLLSPLAWTYAASAFTDVAMVALVFVALERQLAGRAGQAGIAFGLALLAKPTAILLAPLMLMMALTPPAPLSQLWERGEPLYLPLPKLGEGRGEGRISFIMACAAPLLMAWAWDASRAAPSWWVLGAQAYGTLGSLSGNLLSWGRLLLIGLGPLLAVGGVLRWKKLNKCRIQDNPIQLALALTLLFWVPAHMMLGFQPWERYLFPLVPISALLLTTNDRARCLILILPLIIPALIVPFHIEPHDGRWEGIAEMGATIEELPPDAVVYYLDVGRPLAWYAADAKAKLQWVGTEWERLPDLLAQSQHSSHYVILRSTVPLPNEVADWTLISQKRSELIKENSGFHLLYLDLSR